MGRCAGALKCKMAEARTRGREVAGIATRHCPGYRVGQHQLPRYRDIRNIHTNIIYAKACLFGRLAKKGS